MCLMVWVNQKIKLEFRCAIIVYPDADLLSTPPPRRRRRFCLFLPVPLLLLLFSHQFSPANQRRRPLSTKEDHQNYLRSLASVFPIIFLVLPGPALD